MVQSVFFYIFAVLSVTGALIVVSHKNPVTSAISLVLTLFCSAVLFVLLQAHFVAAIQVLVYAGAIIVLFLFTVMFLNIREDALHFDAVNVPRKLTILFMLLSVVGYFSYTASKKVFANTVLALNDNTFGTVEGIGKSLFTDFLLPFELTSILILAAIIGVVVLAKKGDF